MTDATFIIVENNDLYRLGLKCVIQEQFESSITLTVATKLELHSTLLSNSSAVVIIDFDSLLIETIDELTVISACFPDSKWLFIGDLVDVTFLRSLSTTFERANFVLKTNNYETIFTAIKETLSGKKYYCTEALEIVTNKQYRKTEFPAKRNLLTPTELELVQLFTQGKTAKEIADIRCLSYHTVNTHRKNIFRKLEINNIQELIKYALKNGLVDLTEYYI